MFIKNLKPSKGGSDLQAIKTKAVRDGSDWILNGSKVFISNGNNAKMALVAARTDFECKKAAHGISLFLVDTREHKGFTKGGAPLKKIGQPTYDTAELFFDNVRLPNRYFKNKKTLPQFFTIRDTHSIHP